MMKASILLLLSLPAALAAPAIIWKRSSQRDSVVHSSESLTASTVLQDALKQANDSPLPAVVFLLGRTEDGSEGLSQLAQEGSLPQIQGHYETAHCIHHSVTGIESSSAMVREAAAVGSEDQSVLLVSVSEFSSKLTSIGQPPAEEMEIASNGDVTSSKKTRREKELAEANVLIVHVPVADTEAADIDAAVARAIQHESIGTVVLTTVRSLDEVKLERRLLQQRKRSLMAEVPSSSTLVNAPRRRLEQQQQNNNQNNNNNGDQDMTGVYYVHATPNIFAGLLFFFLFVFITWTGISCMGRISGQDVYVSKMPPVGREA